MHETKFDLIIRFDESRQRFLFLATRRPAESSKEFSIDISLEELKNRGADGADKLMGESVLGFFDHLSNGRMNLPKSYRDDGNAS